MNVWPFYAAYSMRNLNRYNFVNMNRIQCMYITLFLDAQRVQNELKSIGQLVRPNSQSGPLCGDGDDTGLHGPTVYIVHCERSIISAVIVGPVHCILNVSAGARDRSGECMYATERGRTAPENTFQRQQTRFTRSFGAFLL